MSVLRYHVEEGGARTYLADAQDQRDQTIHSVHLDGVVIQLLLMKWRFRGSMWMNGRELKLKIKISGWGCVMLFWGWGGVDSLSTKKVGKCSG